MACIHMHIPVGFSNQFTPDLETSRLATLAAGLCTNPQSRAAITSSCRRALQQHAKRLVSWRKSMLRGEILLDQISAPLAASHASPVRVCSFCQARPPSRSGTGSHIKAAFAPLGIPDAASSQIGYPEGFTALQGGAQCKEVPSAEGSRFSHSQGVHVYASISTNTEAHASTC